MSCKITMLPALEGDSFYLEFNYDNKMFTLLIDSGPAACWEISLRVLLDRLIVENKTIDILLITHYDSDHIGGAIKLFKSDIYSSLIRTVWFNGLQQIAADSATNATKLENRVFKELSMLYWHDVEDIDGPISAQQAKSLVQQLSDRGIIINRFIDSAAISNTAPSIKIAPEFYIDFLLPLPRALSNLKSTFQLRINQVASGAAIAITPEGEAAFENVMLDEEDLTERIENISANRNDIQDIENWAKESFNKDTSITNASSIAICIRYHGKKFLFPGDADQESLIASLNNWMSNNNENGYFDVIKLPHHGSGHNCMKLLDIIDGRFFIVSTNGIKYQHPDKETLAKVITRPTANKRNILFNYENDMYRLFKNETMEKKYSYGVYLQTDPLEFGGDSL